MFLANQGGGRKGDLSRFVEEAVRTHLLELIADPAKAVNADYLVTGDRRAELLQRGNIGRMRILTASAFCSEVF